MSFEISIHALREEGDVFIIDFVHVIVISIHALREEGDYKLAAMVSVEGYFYPRPPRGGRLVNGKQRPYGL